MRGGILSGLSRGATPEEQEFWKRVTAEIERIYKQNIFAVHINPLKKDPAKAYSVHIVFDLRELVTKEELSRIRKGEGDEQRGSKPVVHGVAARPASLDTEDFGED